MKKFSNSHAVIGLGFGDEGKGLVTHSLAKSLKNALVVRYSGGQQAGHTVTLDDGRSHVFSNFGSGSFAGAPTYWSKFCTIDPVGIMREHKILLSKGVDPVLYIDRRCPVTTPIEKIADQFDGEAQAHGTCGVGVGKTFAREESFYSFTAGDLQYPSVVDIKLGLIQKHTATVNQLAMDEFLEAVEYIRIQPMISLYIDNYVDADNIIYEGSQGLLLDQHNGFFPHVTRSNTGTKNFIDLYPNVNLYLVTRCYQTRHGNGPMTNEDLVSPVIDNPLETNITNRYQGEFRKSVLDVSLLEYAVDRDPGIRKSKNKTLVVTCCDQMGDEYRYTINGELFRTACRASFVKAIGKELGIENVIAVDNPSTVFSK